MWVVWWGSAVASNSRFASKFRLIILNLIGLKWDYLDRRRHENGGLKNKKQIGPRLWRHLLFPQHFNWK